MKVTIYIDKYTCDRNGCNAVLAGTVADPRPDFRKFGWSTIEGLCTHAVGPCNGPDTHTLHFCSERCKQNARGKWTKMPPPEPSLVEKFNNQTETIQRLQLREKELELKIVTMSKANAFLQDIIKRHRAEVEECSQIILRARNILSQ